MDFVQNIWKKGPFKSDSTEQQESNANTENVSATSDSAFITEEQQQQSQSNAGNSGTRDSFSLTSNLTEQVTGGVNYVSNMFKSTFKSDSVDKERNDSGSTSGEQAAEEREMTGEQHKKESLAAGATNLVTNIWGKSANLFRGDDPENKRKASQASEGEGSQPDVDYQQRSPTEAASQKALDSAKSLGSFVFNMANKAGQTVSATAKQIKRTVETSSLLADFTKEQQDFVREHGGNIQVGEPPWVGCDNEDEVRTQVLSLSQDKRNFVRSPPSTIQFDFDLQQMLPVALVLLKEDENLNKMRFDIVPKLVTEEHFWRNYFYRVSLIKQNNSLSNVNKCNRWESSSEESEGPDDVSPTNPEPEFISDTLQASVTDEELASGMRQLGVRKTDLSKNDKQWEDELTKDLQEFEVVNSDVSSALDAELAKDLAEI